MSRILVSVLLAGACAYANAQSPENAPPARWLGSPPLDNFYPASMERRGVAGAAARAKVCVDARGRLVGDPEVYVSSFYSAFDKAVVAMLKKGRYAAGQIGGEPIPSCVQVAIYGVLAKETTTANREAVQAYAATVNQGLPTLAGELEIRETRYSDNKIIFTKIFWKKSSADYNESNLKAQYRAARDDESKMHCEVKVFEDMFRAGFSIVSWYETSDGQTLFGIVTNEESCVDRFPLS